MEGGLSGRGEMGKEKWRRGEKENFKGGRKGLGGRKGSGGRKGGRKG